MRYIKQGIARNGVGTIVPDATISVYLAGTTTAASIYAASSGGTAVNSVTAGDDGSFTFYVDNADYSYTQFFKVVISKAGLDPSTWDNVIIIPYYGEYYYGDYEIDALMVYGSGTVFTKATIDAALTAIGTTNKATLLLRPGTWVIGANADWSAYKNVTFKIVPGAILSHSTYTLNIPNVEAGLYKIFAGTGLVTLTNIKEIYPQWYGATGDGSTNDTAAMTSALATVELGGKLYIPKGTYMVDPGVLTIAPNGTSTIIYGAGSNATYLKLRSQGILLQMNTTANNYNFFGLRDIGLWGTAGDDGSTLFYMAEQITNAAVENVTFTAAGRCLQLEDIYVCKFKNLRFLNYTYGVLGTSGHAAQNNLFESCNFSDGFSVSPAVAQPINSYCMGNNTYLNCIFESRGLVATVDMRGGAGYDQMIGCRFEQFNAGTSNWLIPGKHQKYIGCLFATSAEFSVYGTSYFVIYLAAAGEGIGNYFNDVNVIATYIGERFVGISSGTTNNTIIMDSAYTANVVTDASTAGSNSVIWANGFGIKSAWVDVKASRSLGATYTNSSSRPMYLSFWATDDTASQYFSATVSGVVVAVTPQQVANQYTSFMVVIPPNATYVIAASGGTPTVSGWFEIY